MQFWQTLEMVTMGKSPSPTLLLISECDKNNSCANICCKPTGQFAYVGDAELQILCYLKGGIPDQRGKESKNATRIEVTELVGEIFGPANNEKADLNQNNSDKGGSL